MRTRHSQQYRYLFGPVLSRRLGRSLGIDLVPLKTCTSNCIFCQLGAATPTLKRREYVPTSEVLAEFDRWLKAGGVADAVTLAGSGEPTLHSRFGDVLAGVRTRCSWRTVLLSNGTLFFLREVREAARRAHVVKASLSSWDQASFERVNRSARALSFQTVVDGLSRFREEYEGDFWIEVFLVRGVNDDESCVRRIAEIVRKLRPDRVHLNTAVRPPAENFVRPIPRGRLNRLAVLFTPPAEVPDPPETTGSGPHLITEDHVVAIVARHPATRQELAGMLGLKSVDIKRMLIGLCRSGAVREIRKGRNVYYVSGGELRC
ncbi:MAG: radical SAM protein [Kiritimatiellae bacterium]|nr:radical SAM protein [Kiritimatiellia bacterium]